MTFLLAVVAVGALTLGYVTGVAVIRRRELERETRRWIRLAQRDQRRRPL